MTLAAFTPCLPLSLMSLATTAPSPHPHPHPHHRHRQHLMTILVPSLLVILADINENAQSTSSSSPLPHLSISSSPMGEVSSRGTSQRRNAGLKRSSQSFSTRDLPSNYGGGGGGPGAPGGPPSPQPILHNLDDDSRTIALQMSLKCADLGHWSSERSVHRKWVSSLEEEFFRQGDCELQAGLPISPLMDRTKGGVTTSQSGFYSIVLQPQLQAMCSVFPGCTPLFEAAKDNLAMWAEEMGTPSRPTSG